ncbi:MULTISPECIES: hypothetical protein [unclassified Streptomyces]|uniref:hypothetical protein n=1 Tax=unclassified Streptomyces TaxID=2593676 RepID=UPI0008DE27A6|nr:MULTISPECIES: hypothetical protein [unclassified Streptomyces]OII66410.1 hypothetical protein BJP39_08750 [Streptomyces sp. CC77]
MGAHAAPARHRRARRLTEGRNTLRWALPATLGFFYGLYAGFLHRGAGPTDWGDVAYGLVSGLVFGVLCFVLGLYQRALPRELRGAAYGALAGVGIGWLFNLSGGSVLASSGLGLGVGAAVGLAAFYLLYTHE